jgi:hypothetical protein
MVGTERFPDNSNCSCYGTVDVFSLSGLQRRSHASCQGGKRPFETHNQIDIRLLNISAQTSQIPFVVDADETRKWWDRADGIIKGVDDAWVIHISQSGSKN